MVSKIKHVGTVRIGTEDYKLAETDDQQAWQEQYLHEPPWLEGLPPVLSEPAETWHLGGLKSKQGIPGTSEYGQNTDARFPFRLLPGPKVSVITLTGSISNPTSFFETLGYLWAVCGRYVFRIDPSDDSVVESKDFGAVISGIEGLEWEENKGLVTVQTPEPQDRTLWEVSSIGTPDTWANAAVGVKPRRIAAGIDRLFGVQFDGLLRNIVSGNDPLVAASWSDEIQCGSKIQIPTGIIVFEKTALVGKPDGLYGVSPEGKGARVISRMTRDVDNCLGLAVIEPHAWVPHSRGLYRFAPGLVESIGLEKEIINEGPVRGRFKAFVSDGQWVFGILPVGSDTYIMVSRDRRGGEPGFGPLIWDTWVFLSGISSESIWLSDLWSPPRLFLGHDNNVGYIKLSTGAGAPDVGDAAYEFALAGKRFTHKYTFGDWRGKDFPKIAVVGKGTLSATRYWDVYYSVDGGAYSVLDIDGNTMRVNSDGLHTFYLPLATVGREVQFRLDFVGDSATAPPELNYFEPFAVPQSKKIPINVIQLHLVRDAKYDIGQEARSAAEQLEDLRVLDEDAAPLKASGPWGENKDMWLKSLRLVSVLQEPDLEAEYLVEVSLQERKVSA